jgi:formylglycine-generating enzyme required for sulfatase activity
VWRARDTELDRIVAIKIPDLSRLTSADQRARFQREARASARLSHPNVVQLFDVDRVEDTPLLVMEYVEGTDLGRLVAQAGPLPVRQACEYVRQAALGLQHAHERGLVHRDVKPSNLMLARSASGGEESWVVKVLDLGLARWRRPEDAEASLTEHGCMMGTADFMAPEQARNASQVDARADIYGLGSSLYYLLTGRVPFPGGTALGKIARRVSDEPPPVEQLQPAVSATLAAVVRKMMARRLEDRYQTAAAVVVALSTVLGSAEVPASPPTPAGLQEPSDGAVTVLKPPPRRRPRRWRMAFLVLVGLVALVGLAGFAALALLLLSAHGGNSNRGDSKKTPPPQAVAPFDAVQAKAHQEAWATHLGVDVEMTNSIGMKLRLIPPGQFLMGTPPELLIRDVNEWPHDVTITQPFYIGRCEVTQGEFFKVMGYNPSHFTRDQGGGDTHPVERVSYLKVVEFCQRLSDLAAEKEAGRAYGPPTEAQWEYACRAGTQTTYFFGETSAQLTDYAWFQDNASGTTHPVGQKTPNAWGLCDTYGNVAEWCKDWYDPNYYRSDAAGTDPCCDDPTTKRRVLRGGAWGETGNARRCRSAVRLRHEPDTVVDYQGLRVVCTVPGHSP